MWGLFDQKKGRLWKDDWIRSWNQPELSNEDKVSGCVVM